MKSFMMLVLFTILLAHAHLTAQFANHVVISEIYCGGGNSGAIFRNDYVELYNPTSASIDISGWSVQYATATGSTWTVTALGLSESIASHAFFLVRLASGGANGDTLPTADAAGSSNLATTAGKIALVNTTTPLSGTNPSDPAMIDYVGYGSTASGFEGTGPAPGGNNTTSIERKAQSSSSSETMPVGGSDEFKGNGWDSNDNSDDILQRPGPQPQNSSSPAEHPPSENQPPTISSVISKVFVPAPGSTDTILATITDDGVIQSARLHLRVNGGIFDSSVFFSILSGTTYYAVVSAGNHAENGHLVEYFISATDDSSAYTSTANALRGYFVGDSPISIIKSYLPADVNNYAVRIGGTINSNTNLFQSNTGYIQDSSGGLRLCAEGMPCLKEGRNAKVEGTIRQYNGGFELTNPNYSFVDTSTGTSAITPAILTLPMIHSPSNANEGRVIEIQSLITDSAGIFAEGKRYIFKNPTNDTITVKVESNGSANSLVGKPLPVSAVDAVGILAYNNTFLELKPRCSADMGMEEGDGTGTATITPTGRLINTSSVSETLTVAGDGINILEGVSVVIPSAWTWSGNINDVTISGTGYSGAVKVISGDGSTGNPWIITMTGASVTGTNVGTVIIRNLMTPPAACLTVFGVKTRVASGVLSDIAVFPAVLISENIFEAIASGNWGSASTWSGGIIPGNSDNVTFTTPDVVVTIDGNANCADLVMSGVDTAGGKLGPALQFSISGPRILTVHGRIELSGGAGGGGGSRGGRPKLTSNGNTDAVLILMGNVYTNVSNTVDRGNAGLNMNEGTVRLIGATNDTLRNGAGLRLANLVIGDGTLQKGVTWVSSATATMYVRSLIIRNGSKLTCGGTTYSTTNTLGNSSSVGLPMLTGGITVESGASLNVNNASGGYNSASINLKDGGITNNGTINLRSLDGSRSYAVYFGEFSADPGGSKQTVTGMSDGIYDFVKVGSLDTIILARSMRVLDTLLLKGELIETEGNTVFGTAVTSRVLAQNVENSCGGIGVTLNALDAAPDTTIIHRTTGLAQMGGGNRSIQRYFDIAPKLNSNLNASIIFRYDTSETNEQDVSSLVLWKSTDGGVSWHYAGGSVDTAERQITVNGIPSFSRWTTADAAHPMESSGQSYYVDPSWNMVSVPLIVPDYRKLILYPFAVSDAFMYNGLYEAQDTLYNGMGYWLKFADRETLSITGTEYLSDTINVADGWNMIGGPSRTLPAGGIEEIPPGIIESQIFGYSGTYASVDTLYPGKAYWVKTATGGQIILNAVLKTGHTAVRQILNDPHLHTLFVTDARGLSKKIFFGAATENEYLLPSYDLPPIPPEGCFDVRFGSNRYLEIFGDLVGQKERAIDILIQGAVYPITLRWNIQEGMPGYYSLDDCENHIIDLKGSGWWTINENVKKVVLLYKAGRQHPCEFSLSENHPNPFNPMTRFTIGIPYNSEVDLSIYDFLGRKIRALFQGNISPGYHQFVWYGESDGGSMVSSGIYCIRLRCEGYTKSRKLILLK